MRSLAKMSIRLIVINAFLFLAPYALAQNISLDHPLKCGQLQCFPSADNEHEYYYLPANPHVALNEEGKHEFSFTRYVTSDTNSQGDGGVVEAEGGGIVHFLVDYSVTEKQKTDALKTLTKIDEDAVLRGPIVFESGNFLLVSSFAPDPDKPTELSKQALGVGRAPLIEGLNAAISIHLTKKGAQILWNSFQMDTPDISMVFEMTFSGLNDPADATVTADWTKLQEQIEVSLGVGASFKGIGGGFDFSNFWQDAQDTGAVTIDYRGDPDKLQNIIDKTITKLHNVMFEPIKVEQPTTDDGGDSLESLLGLANTAKKGGSNGSVLPWEVKLNGGFKRRKLTQSGSYTFNFRQRSKSILTTAMAGNIGSMHRLYGNDPTVFRTVNLSDPEFRVREISVALDARDEKEFAKYINHVTLTVKKAHGSGEESTGELVIKRSNFESGRPQKLSYHWDDEENLESWMSYRYKADWSFVGGAQHTSGWVDYDSAAISLTPPYQYREIEFVTSPDILAEEDVRLVSVRVNHDFFGRPVSETINIIPSRDQFNVSRIFAVPPGSEALKYSITWTLNDRRKLNSGTLHSDETVIFCDELPEQF